MSELITNNSIQGPKKALKPALNFQHLRKLGLATIIDTGSENWTDYNEHDPGITILETLAFGLTDLGYRTDFPIEDVLAQQGFSVEDLAEKQFYTARNMLTSDPVTFTDLRKTIIDQPGIDNAWIQKSRDSLNAFGGIIDILVDAPEVSHDPMQAKNIDSVVETVYYKHRMLGQDLGQIIIRQPLEILLNLKLVLAPTAMAERVVAAALVALDGFISSTVNFLSLQEMLEKVGGDINLVFEGPALAHGFLPNDALLPIRKKINATDLLPVLNEIPEVVIATSLTLLTSFQAEAALIKNIGTKNTGISTNWNNQVLIPRTNRPILAAPQKHQFFIKKGDTPVELNLNRLAFEIKKLKSHRRTPKLRPQKRDIPIPMGNFRNIEQYFSIQQDFPQIYGLDPVGPPPNASETQLGQIKQLKAYLLFFDQMMANYLAQLSNLGQLFSWDESITQTYFHQGLESAVNNLGEFLFDFPLHQNATNQNIATVALGKYKQKLMEFREDEATFLNRRNRFLDHLLARFGRNLTTYLEHINKENPKAQKKAEMETKLRILNHYPTMSARRGRAYNRYKQADFADQFSGLRQWTEQLLDMAPESEAALHFNKRFVNSNYKEGGNTEGYPFSKYILKTDDGSPLDMKEIMRIGRDRENYQIDYRKDKEHHILLYKLTKPTQPAKIYQLVETYDNVEKTLEVIDELAELIDKYDKTSECIQIVEHLLLRPMDNESYFGLQLLNTSGNVWMQTKDWYAKEDLAQVTKPPVSEEQFYYCIKTEDQPDPPCSKIIIDKEKSSAGNIITKTIYPKYIFFIEPIHPPAPILRYQVKLLFGALGKIIELTSTTPFETKAIAKVAVDNWMSRLKRHFEQEQSTPIQAPLWQSILKPWPATNNSSKNCQSILTNPYSFIFTVAIPNWPSRFQDKSFQVALEKILNLECSAHLLPNIIWLDKSKMQTFERLHTSWWSAYLAMEPDAYCFREELMEFIMQHSKYSVK